MPQKPRTQFDQIFLSYLLVLVFIGLMALFSASQPAGIQRFGDGNYFIKKQIFFGLIPGLILGFAAFRIGYEWIKKFSWLAYFVAIAALAAVFIPGIGLVVNGSRSWLILFGMTFQPAEFAKIAVAMIMAALLANPKYDWQNWQTSLLPVLAIVSPILILVAAQPDVGTLFIIAGEVFGMLVIANLPKTQLLILATLGLMALLVLIFAAPYRVKRMAVFINPELDPAGYGYQMNQSFMAIGSGGFTGFGLWQSRQKYQYLPEASADTIFAIFAEETGFIGAFLVVMLILFLVWRGLKISKGSRDYYGTLLAAGIMIWFGWQSFMNIGATVGATPLTGVPLPFVSHGGSALAMALLASGIVLAISKQSKNN